MIAWLSTHLPTAAHGVSARASAPCAPLMRARGCRAAGRVRLFDALHAISIIALRLGRLG